MAHVLILGMTLSGKTYKAKALARDYKKAGIGVLVLDPLCDPEWQADFITDDPNRFLDVFWKSRSCMAFMDEGGESVGRYNLPMQTTARRGRHWGHVCHYVTQEATDLAPVVRNQCTRLFLFCSSVDSGEILAKAWNRPELKECNKLKQGEYFYAVKMGNLITNRSADNGNISDSGGTRNDSSRSAANGRGKSTKEDASGNASDGKTVSGGENDASRIGNSDGVSS